jgi:DNA-binding transcriptional LysR family regulator
VEVSVICEQSTELIRMAQTDDLDLAIVTHCGDGPVEVIRREPLLWVASQQHNSLETDVLPLAMFKAPCQWRTAALEALDGIGRPYRVLYQSANSAAIAAAVTAGLAVTVVTESALRPGMRVVGDADGFPKLPQCEIGLVRARRGPATPIVDKLAEHIVSALDNLSVPVAA